MTPTTVETQHSPKRPLTKRKTVVEMLLSESVCLGNFEVATLRQLISSSKILEEDRKTYLLQELTLGVIGR